MLFRSIQLGYSGGIVTSGYLGSATNNGTQSNHSNGFRDGNQSGSCVRHGSFVLTLLGSNIWTCACSMARSDAGTYNVIAGSVTLSGALTTVRATTYNGTDTFDSGSINVFYE